MGGRRHGLPSHTLTHTAPASSHPPQFPHSIHMTGEVPHNYPVLMTTMQVIQTKYSIKGFELVIGPIWASEIVKRAVWILAISIGTQFSLL